jgi:hypothetical protein
VPPRDPEPELRYAARKPTVQDMLATIERHNKTCTDFLKADVEAAVTFMEIARSAQNPAEQDRNRHAARRAYDTVIRLIGRVKLTDADSQVLGARLARLKSGLCRLGERL